MASFSLSTFRLPRANQYPYISAPRLKTRTVIYLHHPDHPQKHTLFDLAPSQDLFLRRTIHADPASFPEFISTTYISTIPFSLVPCFVKLVHEAMAGNMDAEIDYMRIAKDFAGGMTIMEGVVGTDEDGKGKEGSSGRSSEKREGSPAASALFMMEDMMLKEVFKVQLGVIIRMLRGPALQKAKEREMQEVKEGKPRGKEAKMRIPALRIGEETGKENWGFENGGETTPIATARTWPRLD